MSLIIEQIFSRKNYFDLDQPTDRIANIYSISGSQIIQSKNFFGKAERYKEYLELQPHTSEEEKHPVRQAIEECMERGDY